jgi:TetR/AcrR family transcriptional regulator, cholesterol catabolism regulator
MRRARSDRLRTDSKSARTRRRILDAGASAFRRDGYASVTLKDIAVLAGLQAGSLYYHFRSKEEIVENVLEVGLDGVAAATREAVHALGKNADPVARLRAAIAAHLKFVLAESDYAVANIRILTQVPKEIRQRHLRRQRRYGAFWRALFESAAKAGALRKDLDLSVVRMLTLGALNWSVEWYDENRRRGPEEIAGHLSTMILEGLRRATKERARSRFDGISRP